MTATNAVKTVSTVAKEALRLLDNNLVFGSLVNRGYDAEFAKRVNGYKVGDTVPIRKPARYTVRSGRVASQQNSTEKTVDLKVDTQEGVDLNFTSADMTLSVSDFSDRFLKAAMIQLANSVDAKLAALYKNVWNWVGTPATVISTYAAYGRGPQRLDEMAVPPGERVGALSPADTWGLIPSVAGLYITDSAKNALQKAKLPMIGNTDLYASQNIQTHTVGPLGGSPLVNGAAQNVTYDGTNAQIAHYGRLDRGGGGSAQQGRRVHDCRRVRRQSRHPGDVAVSATVRCERGRLLGRRRQSDREHFPGNHHVGRVSDCLAAPADNAAITVLGTAATGYNANMVFHRDAFALAMVPMERPEGAVKVYTETYKGLSVRIIPYYDGANDEGNWRLDVLYGVKAIFPDLATRING
jgi:hypothetical protein